MTKTKTCLSIARQGVKDAILIGEVPGGYDEAFPWTPGCDEMLVAVRRVRRRAS